MTMQVAVERMLEYAGKCSCAGLAVVLPFLNRRYGAMNQGAEKRFFGIVWVNARCTTPTIARDGVSRWPLLVTSLYSNLQDVSGKLNTSICEGFLNDHILIYVKTSFSIGNLNSRWFANISGWCPSINAGFWNLFGDLRVQALSAYPQSTPTRCK